MKHPFKSKVCVKETEIDSQKNANKKIYIPVIIKI